MLRRVKSSFSKLSIFSKDKKTYEIPKIFHFIWAGGKKLMPENNILEILKWMQNNPSFNFWLWIDDKTSPPGLRESYMNLFAEVAKKNNIAFNSNQLQFKDITAENVVSDFARYEIDKLRPNYGASSDLLRYEILYQFGGVYFDSDIGPGNISFEALDIFNKKLKQHELYIDRNGQGTVEIGNDALISTRENPHIQMIANLAREKYSPGKKAILNNDDGYYSNCSPAVAAYATEDSTLDSGLTASNLITIYTTGPSTVRDVAKYVARQDDNNNNKVTAVIKDILENWRTHRRDIGKSWVGVPVKRYNVDDAEQLTEAIESLQMTIVFEAKHKKILRLEDHVSNLQDSLNISAAEAEKMLIALLEKLEDLNYQSLLVVQNSFKYDGLQKFCKEHNIRATQFLHYPDLENIAQYNPDHTLLLSDAGLISYVIGQIIDSESIRKTMYVFLNGEFKKGKDFTTLDQWEFMVENLIKGISFLDHYISKLTEDLDNLQNNSSIDADKLTILEKYHKILNYNFRSYDLVFFNRVNDGSIVNVPEALLKAKRETQDKLAEIQKILVQCNENHPQIKLKQ